MKQKVLRIVSRNVERHVVRRSSMHPTEIVRQLASADGETAGAARSVCVRLPRQQLDAVVRELAEQLRKQTRALEMTTHALWDDGDRARVEREGERIRGIHGRGVSVAMAHANAECRPAQADEVPRPSIFLGNTDR